MKLLILFVPAGKGGKGFGGKKIFFDIMKFECYEALIKKNLASSWGKIKTHTFHRPGLQLLLVLLQGERSNRF